MTTDELLKLFIIDFYGDHYRDIYVFNYTIDNGVIIAKFNKNTYPETIEINHLDYLTFIFNMCNKLI